MRFKNSLNILVCFFIILFGFKDLYAHDYWIFPESFYPHENSILDVRFTCGHEYFENQETPDIMKFRLFLTNPAGKEIPLAYSSIHHKAAWAKVPISGPGTYIITAFNLVPSYWCKTPNGWKNVKKTEVKNPERCGRYFKSTKTFLTVKKSTSIYKTLLGLPIEMVPLRDPLSLKEGEVLPIKVLYKGKAIGNVPVFWIYKGSKKGKVNYSEGLKTDSDGIAKIKIDHSGIWLLGARYEFEVQGDPLCDYENYRPYILFKVTK